MREHRTMQISVLDFFFPKRSLTGMEGEWVHAFERNSIMMLLTRETGLALRKRGIEHLDYLVSAAPYDASPVLRRAIRMMKYHRVRAVEGELVRLLTMVARDRRASCAGAALCPVPLHWTREFQRGFNQAEILAGGIAGASGLPVRRLLCRVRPTGHQAHRKRKERMYAMRGAFRVRRHEDLPAHVILVDDIATTGATLDACAKTLKDTGVTRVEAWVVARG